MKSNTPRLESTKLTLSNDMKEDAVNAQAHATQTHAQCAMALQGQVTDQTATTPRETAAGAPIDDLMKG